MLARLNLEKLGLGTTVTGIRHGFGRLSTHSSRISSVFLLHNNVSLVLFMHLDILLLGLRLWLRLRLGHWRKHLTHSCSFLKVFGNLQCLSSIGFSFGLLLLCSGIVKGIFRLTLNRLDAEIFNEALH